MRITKNTIIINGIRTDINNNGELMRVQCYIYNKSFDYRIDGYSNSTRLLNNMYSKEFIERESIKVHKQELKDFFNRVKDLNLFNEIQLKDLERDIKQSYYTNQYLRIIANTLEQLTLIYDNKQYIEKYIEENKENLKRQFLSEDLQEKLASKQDTKTTIVKI